MADAEDFKSPDVNCEESADGKTAIVKMVIPKLPINKKFFGANTLKDDEAEVDYKFEEMGFELTARIGKGANKTTYYHKVKELPGPIDKTTSSIEYKKDIIVLKLVKADDSSWAVKLDRNGLEQAAD